MSDTQKVSAAPRRKTRTCEQTGPLSIREVRALPAAVDLVTAGRALNIGRSLTYELAATGQFPIPVLSLGTPLTTRQTAPGEPLATPTHRGRPRRACRPLAGS